MGIMIGRRIGAAHTNGDFIPTLSMTVKNGKHHTKERNRWDHHLRSTHAVSGYHIQALDGEIGHVEDFIIDDETWAIRYLMVNTHNFWPGRKVLISPQWIENVSWDESKVFVNLSRDAIKRHRNTRRIF